MKIGFVHPSWPGGDGTGATHSATQIVEGLADLGFDLTVYCTTPPQREEVRNDIELRELFTNGFPYHTATQLNRQIKSRTEEIEQFDVFHSYLMSTIPALEYLGKKGACATMVTLNAYGGVCAKNTLRYMDREACEENGLVRCIACCIATSGGDESHSAVYRSASRLMSLRYILAQDPESTNIDAFHALSEHVKQTYETFSYPSERISVVPNALDERFLIPHQSSFEEPYRLLYVGYLEEHKGVRKLIEIMQRLHTDHDGEFRLTIAGDGGLRSELESLAEQSSVDEHIDFLGHVEYERLPDLYANHDLFVYPGEWDEPFGRVFLEALATGTPTIASNVGAADEILGSGGIATSGSVTDIADGIEELCTSGELRSLSEAAASETERFRRDSVVDDFVQLYRHIADA